MAIDNLLKLLNQNAKNKFYQENVPPMLEELGKVAVRKDGKYVLEDKVETKDEP